MISCAPATSYPYAAECESISPPWNLMSVDLTSAINILWKQEYHAHAARFPPSLTSLTRGGAAHCQTAFPWRRRASSSSLAGRPSVVLTAEATHIFRILVSALDLLVCYVGDKAEISMRSVGWRLPMCVLGSGQPNFFSAGYSGAGGYCQFFKVFDPKQKLFGEKMFVKLTEYSVFCRIFDICQNMKEALNSI